MTDEQRTTTANSGLAKGGVSCFVETFVVKQTFVLRINFSAKNPALRQAAKRCAAIRRHIGRRIPSIDARPERRTSTNLLNHSGLESPPATA